MRYLRENRQIAALIGIGAVVCLIMISAPYDAYGEGTAPANAATTEAKDAKKLDAKPLEQLSLNDIQDTGILVRNIQQGAINIYEEAARAKLSLTSAAELPQFRSIPVKLPSTEMMPARQEWLVYYLGSVEPVVRELGQDVKDINNGMKQLVFPGTMQKTLGPLWDSWAADVTELNKHLDELVPLFDDAPHNNSKIRDVAVKIYDDTNRMEDLRKTIFKAVQQGEKDHPDSKIMISPF
jgi:hypothetical protein